MRGVDTVWYPRECPQGVALHLFVHPLATYLSELPNVELALHGIVSDLHELSFHWETCYISPTQTLAESTRTHRASDVSRQGAGNPKYVGASFFDSGQANTPRCQTHGARPQVDH